MDDIFVFILSKAVSDDTISDIYKMGGRGESGTIQT